MLNQRPILRRALKLIVAVILLLVLLLGVLRIPLVQNAIKDKVFTTLSENYDADWSVGSVRIDFFDEVVAQDILLLDQLGDTLLSADRLFVDIGLFSLLRKDVHLDAIEIDQVISHIYTLDANRHNFSFLVPKQMPKRRKESTVSTWEVTLGNILLDITGVSYGSDSLQVALRRGVLEADFENLDLSGNAISFHSIDLKDCDVDVLLISPPPNPTSEGVVLPTSPWCVDSDQINLEMISARVIVDSADHQVLLQDLNLNGASYCGNHLQVDLDHAAATYDDFAVTEARLDLSIDSSMIILGDLHVQSKKDQLAADRINLDLRKSSMQSNGISAHLSHTTLAKMEGVLPDNVMLKPGADLDLMATSISHKGSRTAATGLTAAYAGVVDVVGNGTYINSKTSPRFDIDLVQFRLKMSEVDAVLRDVDLPSALDTVQTLSITGHAEGTLAAVEVSNLTISADDIMKVSGSGTVDYDKTTAALAYDLDLLTARVDARYFPGFVPQNLALDSLGVVSYEGRLQGSTTDLTIDGTIDSEIGRIIADLRVSGLDEELAYRGEVELVDVQLGKVMQNDSVGSVSLDLRVDGRGSALDRLRGSVEGKVSSFVYRGYDYQDILLDVTGDNDVINGHVSIDDDHVQLDYKGTIDVSGEQKVLAFIMNLDTLELQALGLSQQDLRVSGSVVSALHLPMTSSDLSTLSVTDLYLTDGQTRFYEDSLGVQIRTKTDSTFFTLDSDAIALSAVGEYSLDRLAGDTERLLAYHMGRDTIAAMESDQNVFVTGQIHTLLPLDILLSQTSIQAGRIDIDVAVDFATHAIDGGLSADSIIVGSAIMPSATLAFTTKDDLLIDLEVKETTLGALDIPLIRIDNNVDRGRIDSDFLATDRDNLPTLKFYLQTMQQDDHWQVSLDDSLVVNSKDWSVSPDNIFRWYGDYFTIEDLELTDTREYLRLATVGDHGQDLEMDFKNFQIGQFVTFLTSKPSRLSGNLNGNIDVQDVQRDPYLVINIEVEDILYDSTTVGTIAVAAEDNPQTGVVSTALRLTGPINEMRGSGKYDRNRDYATFDLDIANLEMKLLDPFLSTIIKDSKGLLRGDATFRGTLEEPIINGQVDLDDVITTIVLTQARYAVDQHTISFDNSSIDIGTLDLYDDQNQTATLSGKIYHDFLQDFYLDLALDADQFTFLNTTAGDNPVFYGKLKLSAGGTIVGPVDLLQVDIKAKTLPTTAVTISPFSAERYLLEEDFVAYGKPQDYKDKSSDYLLKLARAYPFKVNLLLDATDEAVVNFVIDPLSGDKIRAQGSGDLRIKLDPDGKQEIFGTYVVSDGSYNFSYGDFVNKDFGVREGGTIRFNGNPLSAQLDIKAVYEVYTTTYELIKNEVVLDDNELSAAQDRTLVNVLLGLRGTLTAPEIELDIEIPTLQNGSSITSIDRKLSELRNDQNALNNQVFGLLLFDSFLMTDNAASGFNTLGSNVALSSVSNLISTQLNRLANKAIKGLDVSVDVNSYDNRYANGGVGGNVTEVGLQVSKQLFNDRLSLTAGGNVDIEGGEGQSTYSNFIGDFVLEYRLSEDGRYRLRVFSKTDYDRLLNENTARNGVSLFFNKSFDSKVDENK